MTPLTIWNLAVYPKELKIGTQTCLYTNDQSIIHSIQNMETTQVSTNR